MKETDLSAAVTCYLRHYPGRNHEEFERTYGPDARNVRKRLEELLKETTTIEPDWKALSLREAGDYVATVMGERHPDLSPAALESIANYFTYLMR